MASDSPLKLAVVGGGWAGLAAAVRATQQGHQVTLFEMSPQLGGRAREVQVGGQSLDNGQHILIGAYSRTLALMSTIGADWHALFHRQPLELRYPDGRGIKLKAGPAWLMFAWAVLGCPAWSLKDRAAFLSAAAGWALARFKCKPELTVANLCASVPRSLRELLIDPLCVAALNTPAEQASASVWLRVLRDALFSGPGSADLLLPRRPLSELVPWPAEQWLQRAGAEVRLGRRVQSLKETGGSWRIDGEAFDAVVLACSAKEAARLAADHAPAWAGLTLALEYEPIVTVYLRCEGARLPAPMVALQASDQAPAQFVFDHGAMGASPGLFAFVISGASTWVERGAAATEAAVLAQAQEAFSNGTWPRTPSVLNTMMEKRATFACRPGLHRPPANVCKGLVAAGDYIDGPYPATLEGAVRSGETAAALLSEVRAASVAQ